MGLILPLPIAFLLELQASCHLVPQVETLGTNERDLREFPHEEILMSESNF